MARITGNQRHARILLRTRCTRSATTVLAALLLLACSPFAPTANVPRVFPTPTATWAPQPTNTPTPSEILSHEMTAISTFRGHLITAGVDGSYQTAHVWIVVADTSLASVQWDALQAQRAAWQGNQSILPDGWIVAIHLYDGLMGEGGKPIAVADVGTASGRRVNWSQVSPAQAWQLYDDKLYNTQGI